MSATLPPFYELGPDNKGPIVVVVGYCFVFISILLTAARVASVILLHRDWSWDDACVVVSTVLALAQTILSEHAVNSGLGRHISALDAASLEFYYKFTYANQLLAILVMALAKLSVMILILRLSRRRTLNRACHIIILVIIAWAVFSVLSIGFQCDLPGPWVYRADRCFGGGALWYPVVLLNILTDLVLAFLFIPVIVKLQMRRGRQIIICSLFASRLIVCGTGIAQLVNLPEALQAGDQTWATVKFAVLTQVTMDLSVMTAVMPSLFRFFSELQAGHGTRLPSGYRNAYELSNLSSTKNQFVNGNNIATLTNRIFADPGEFSDGDSRPLTERKQRNGGDGGVLQKWEITFEVEDADEAVQHSSDHSRTGSKNMI